MKPNEKIREEILAHAKREYPRECCGVIVISKGKQKYFPCANISDTSTEFVISSRDYAEASRSGEIKTIVHSHTKKPPKPTGADLTECERSGLPWYIINPLTEADFYFEPCGFVMPLIGREYVWGIHDCYALVRDWYKQERGIELTNYEREYEFWTAEKGRKDYYNEYYAREGFAQIPLGQYQTGDIILMQIRSDGIDNHAAIYLDGDFILHHCQDRLSSRDVYGGYWRKHTTKALRYIGKK